MGRELQLTGEECGFELGEAVATVAVALEYRCEVGHRVDIDVGIVGILLTVGDSRGVGATVAFGDQFDRPAVPVEEVATGSQSLDVVDDQVRIEERGSLGVERVERGAVRRPRERGREERK